MGYTYLADYSGKIEHDEPHVVKWQPMEVMVNGRFGRYNQLVAESLNDMNIKYQYHVDMNALTLDVTQIIDGHYNGEVKLDFIRKEWGYNHYNIYFVDDNGELEETFGFDKSLDKKLDIVSKKYGVKVKLSSEYYCK
jgi:hypothetical protein